VSLPVEPQKRTQLSVNGAKGVEIRKLEMSLHLSGYMEMCQYTMQA